jgi:glycine amidinotransferase
MKINSHNEWDRLIEVVVGTATGTSATLEWHKEEKIDEKVYEEALEICRQATPKRILDETNEDLSNLAKTISDWGAKVYRPNVHDISKIYSSPFWSSNGNNVYNVRDLNLVVGNNVIESPSQQISRYFESTTLYDIWYKYFDEGFTWISAPRPILKKDPLQPYYRDEKERTLTDEDLKHKELTGGRLEKLHRLSENEILFEAANTLRMGKDLIYLVSSSGNYKGAKWLRSVLKNEYNVHITDKLYRASHIDSTLMCLKPGLIMLNSKRAKKENIPEILNKWEQIWHEDVAPPSDDELDFQKNTRDKLAKRLQELGFNTNLSGMSSPWVGMNFLSLDKETVIVEERQKSLIKVLELKKFKVIPVKMRHMYTQGGGIHCATLDTVRDSVYESYF